MPAIGVHNHPQRAKIDAMIVQGIPLARIARSVNPPLDRSTISRYRDTVLTPGMNPLQAITKALADNNIHVSPENQASVHRAVGQAAATVAAASPFLARLAEYDDIERAGVREMYETKDFRNLPNMLNSATRRVEVAARISGVIDAPSAHSGNTIVFILPESQQQSTPQHLVDDVDIIDVEPASD